MSGRFSSSRTTRRLPTGVGSRKRKTFTTTMTSAMTVGRRKRPITTTTSVMTAEPRKRPTGNTLLTSLMFQGSCLGESNVDDDEVHADVGVCRESSCGPGFGTAQVGGGEVPRDGGSGHHLGQ